jgi:hypothetical protein
MDKLHCFRDSEHMVETDSMVVCFGVAVDRQERERIGSLFRSDIGLFRSSFCIVRSCICVGVGATVLTMRPTTFWATCWLFGYG